jgi:hypothetical protein
MEHLYFDTFRITSDILARLLFLKVLKFKRATALKYDHIPKFGVRFFIHFVYSNEKMTVQQ